MRRAYTWIKQGFLLFTAVFMLAACMPREQIFTPPFESPTIINQKLLTGNATVLPVRSWLPEGGKEPEAVIVALHGFNDYSNAFVAPGHYFAGHGLGVYSYDQRGFGATDERGIWAGERNLIEDLRQMVMAVSELHPDTPLYLLGESMGGAVVINALAQDAFPEVEGAILSAPAVWGSHTMNPFYRATLWAGAHVVPWKHVTGKGLKILASDNFAMLREMGRDPLIIKKTRVDAVYGIVQLMDDAYLNAKHVKVPLLLLYGMNDQVIPARPILEVVDTLQAPYKMVYYPLGFHMLLRDLRSEVVMDDVIAWIGDHKGFLPSGYDLNWRDFFPIGDSE